MMRLHPSTIAFINLCFNIVVRAVVLVISFAILLAISIPLHWLINYVLDVANAPDALKGRLSLIAFVVPAITGVAIVLTGAGDVLNIAKASLKIPGDQDRTDDSK